MNAKGRITGLIKQNFFKCLAVIAILAAFISALYVNFGVRAETEANSKTVGIMIDYDELGRIADGNPEVSFSDMLRIAYDAGATALVVRERILAEWQMSGDILMFSGRELNFYLNSSNASTSGNTASGMNISPTKTYILTKDQLLYDQIFALLEARSRNPGSFSVPNYLCIEVQLHSSERATLGMGFPIDQLSEAAAIGYQIVPRLRNWEPLTPEGLETIMQWVELIPNIGALGFNDLTVPGNGTDPLLQDMLAEAIAPLGKPLVEFEFYVQEGLSGLAARLDNNLIRAHTIADGELRRYAEFQVAMDRYSLAATERNMRYIYVKFQGLANPGAMTESNLELLAGVHDGLIDDGLTIGDPMPIPNYKIGLLPKFLLGAGIIAAGGLFFALAAEPFAKKKWRLPYGFIVIAGCLLWAAAMLLAPTLSRKLLSLAGAIVFPCLSVTLVLIYKPKARSAESSVKRAILAVEQLLIMSAMTLAGAMIISAILAEPTFMLKIDSFFGVKVSHIIPLVLVPCVLWLRDEDWFGVMSGTVKSSVKYWQVIIGAALLTAFYIYVRRTGNEGAELVTGLELQLRQILNNILGVRPRTKEFLIGHPVMILLLFYGYKLPMFPLVMVGLIGQISIINTYAHLHTPIMISLLRSANGLWIGIIIGIIVIIVLPWIIRRVLTFIHKHENKVVET